MLSRIQEAAISPWWIVTAGLIAWLMWAARRFATRHPKEPLMKVTDPVCGMLIEAEQAFSKTAYGHKTYYFCSEACRKRFDAAPGKYAVQAERGLGGHH
jgi:YHS domain-containing protein